MALVMLLLFAITPNTTNQVALLFHAKVHILCILISLLSRVELQRAERGSNLHTKTSPTDLRTTTGTVSTAVEIAEWQYLPGGDSSVNKLV